MDRQNKILIAYASGLGAGNQDCDKGPETVINSPEFQSIKSQFTTIDILSSKQKIEKLEAVPEIAQLSTTLANHTKNSDFFIVLGGDHTSAIGTFSGASLKHKDKGDFGLIWLDAHLDSHTPETSYTKNPHGMPLAVLLGHGDDRLTSIGYALKPENVCVVGARSYENAEHEFLKSLNVKIFYMSEIEERRVSAVFQDAVDHVTKNTVSFGISFDVDALDPKDAPGTGIHEENGIRWSELLPEFEALKHNKKFMGMDITEFNPVRDIDRRTEKVVIDTIKTVL